MWYRNNMLMAVLAMAFLGLVAVLILTFMLLKKPPPDQGLMANFTIFEKPSMAPAIEFRTEDGRAVSLANWRGKVVLVNFWATWCAPCRREMPELDKLQKRLGGDRFEVIALSSDRKGLALIKPFYKNIGVQNLKIYYDKTSRAQRAFKVVGLPTTVLINEKGQYIGQMIGPAEWYSEEAVALIRQFLDY